MLTLWFSIKLGAMAATAVASYRVTAWGFSWISNKLAFWTKK